MAPRSRTPVGLAALALLSVLFVAAPTPLRAQDATGQGEPPAAVEVETPPDPVLLSDIPGEAEEYLDLQASIHARASDTAGARTLAAEIDRLEAIAADLAGVQQDRQRLSTGDLFEHARRINVELAEADRLSGDIKALAEQAEADLDTLAALGQHWRGLDSVAVERSAPAPIRTLVSNTIGAVDSLTAEARQRRDQLLGFLARLSEVRIGMNALHQEISRRRVEAAAQTARTEGLPIWQLGGQQSATFALASLRAELSADLRALGDYLRVEWRRIFLIVLLTWVASMLALTRLRDVARSDEVAAAVKTTRALSHPFVGALLLTLLALAYAAPSPPALVSVLVWGLIPFPAAILAESILGRGVRSSIWATAVAVALLPISHYTLQLPLIDRLLTIVQIGLPTAALFLDWRSGAWADVVRDRKGSDWVRWIYYATLAVMLVALLSTVVGWVGAARTLRNGAVSHLGFAMVFYAAAELLWVAFNVLLNTELAKRLSIARKEKATLRRWIGSAIVFAAVGAWLTWTLLAYGVGFKVLDAIQFVLATTIHVGALSIPVGSVLLFLIVVMAAFAVAGVICFLLAEEVLPRLTLARGVAYAVTTATRYVILLGGFILAAIAAGFDITRVTLLAGAFGVGLGFGLQDVVNNFISGLILMFERPIQPGDIVEVDSTMGRVTRIGIRSSTVLTFQGAEVVVPNGALISGKVTNWTLSNQRRRFEIAVGVAYGTDTALTREVLLRSAADHPHVSHDPEPVVIFQGFGDSALEFELWCWVDHMEDAVAVASDLRFAIGKALAEAGIEVPFPQRDIHVKSMPPTGEVQSAVQPSGPIRT